MLLPLRLLPLEPLLPLLPLLLLLLLLLLLRLLLLLLYSPLLRPDGLLPPPLPMISVFTPLHPSRGCLKRGMGERLCQGVRTIMTTRYSWYIPHCAPVQRVLFLRPRSYRVGILYSATSRLSFCLSDPATDEKLLDRPPVLRDAILLLAVVRTQTNLRPLLGNAATASPNPVFSTTVITPSTNNAFLLTTTILLFLFFAPPVLSFSLPARMSLTKPKDDV